MSLFIICNTCNAILTIHNIQKSYILKIKYKVNYEIAKINPEM